MSDIEETNAVATQVVKEQTKGKRGDSNTGRMVLEAIKNLDEKHGSSYVKIKNYIVANNDIDFNRYKTLIKKFIATALAKGIISNTSKKLGTQHGLFKIVDAKKKNKKKVVKETDETPIDEDEVVPAKKKKIAKIVTKNVASPQVKKPKSKSIKASVAVSGKKKAKPRAKATLVEDEQPSNESAEKTTKKKKTVKDQSKKSKKVAEDQATNSKKTAKPKKKAATDGEQKEGAKSKKASNDKKKAAAKPKKTAAKPEKKLKEASSKDDETTSN